MTHRAGKPVKGSEIKLRKKKKRWKDETTRSRQLGKYHEGVAEGTYPATAQAHAQNKRRQLDNHAYRHMAILKD